MGNMGYSSSSCGSYRRVGRRYSWRPDGGGRGRGRGFRLNPKRFSVVMKVRVKLMHLFRLCEQALESLKRGFFTRSMRRRRRKTSLVMNDDDCRFRSSSFARTNSFYAEAIADCLEFIKRSSLSSHSLDHDIITSPPHPHLRTDR